MNEVQKTLAINVRRIFRLVFGYKDKFETTSENSDYFGQAASNVIREGLTSNAPFLISRFGYSELRTVLTFLHIHENDHHIRKLLKFMSGQKVEPWWSPNTLKLITHNAGFFPREIGKVEDFCRLVLHDMQHIDVLGSWLGGEKWVKPMLPNTKFVRLHDFYHFIHLDPWTTALRDKKVLVIHPFSKSIQQQFQIKSKIFTGIHRLPDFKLRTYKAVQSIAGNKPAGFKTWFDALDMMKSDLSKIDFDIAILGCGAYGMPLASFIKIELGRKAIHIGGGTQILFGIKGSRWETDPTFSGIFNPHWRKPLPEETPNGHCTIDSNCYW
jgi:hypothetical protein